jgi:NET1-associated nuclear protein 1 (U3 small nucleolar RNA-associated protein 17)
MPFTAGGNITKFPLTYSLDAKILFSCCSNVVKMFGALSCEHVGVLKGHTATVVGVCPNPSNRLQVFSASRDGTVRVWDMSDGACLEVIQMGAPVEQFVVVGDTIIANVDPKPHKRFEDQPRSCRVVSYHLLTKTLTKLYKSKACVGIAVQDDVVASIGTNSLTIFRRSTKKLTRLTHSHSLTTVAFHPLDPYLATGDNEGRITLWHGYDSPNVVTSHLHWHAHGVSALAFSADGSYLLSGGEEAVLVLWQLDTGHKQFLPRLGSTLRHITISPTGNQFAIGGGDNCIRFVSAVSSRIERVIQGLAHAHTHALRRGQRGLRTGLVNHPSQNWVVLQGMPGRIQFYDVFSDRDMGEVAITNRNLVSRTHKQLPNANRVDIIAFHPTGDWLATVDRWVDTGRSDLVCLKVWARNKQGSPAYVNHTRVDNPHKVKVSCLCFHPSRSMFVSGAVDGSFKIWEPVRRAQSQRTLLSSPAWQVRAEGSYRRGSPIYDAAFSSDGSLLALGCGQVITLWDPETLALRKTLCFSTSPKQHVRWLRFVPETQFLVAANSQSLHVWDLLTLTVHWSYEMAVAGLAIRGGSSPLVAVASRLADKKTEAVEEAKSPTMETNKQEIETCSLLLFNPNSPIPIHHIQVSDLKLELAKDLRADAALCILEKENQSYLVYRNKFKQLVALNCDGSDFCSSPLTDNSNHPTTEQSAESIKPMDVAQYQDPMSLFTQLYEPVAAPSSSSYQPSHIPAASAGASSRLRNPAVFEAPSHVLPNMSVLFSAFMELVLKKSPVVASGALSKRARIDDESEESEEVQPSAVHSMTNSFPVALAVDDKYLA